MAERSTKSWKEVRAQRPLDEKRTAIHRTLMEIDVRLGELRQRRGVSQAAVAEALGATQPNVSRIETEDDVYVSTLVRFIVALGGRLEVTAVFPDERVTIIS